MKSEALYTTPDGLFAVFEIKKYLTPPPNGKNQFVVLGKSYGGWHWVAGPFENETQARHWANKAIRPKKLQPKNRSHLRVVK